MFTSADKQQLREKGISLKEAEIQLEYFQKGIEFIRLVKPAVPEDGISVFSDKQTKALINFYEKNSHKISSLKFVPASGAASRMFKHLFEAKNNLSATEDEEKYLAENPIIKSFFANLKDYPFFIDLKKKAEEKEFNIQDLLNRSKYSKILSLILDEKGINYGNLPKGLLKFHSYENETRTAFGEHFEEAAGYLVDEQKEVLLHFTVSPEHLPLFEELAEHLKKQHFEKTGIRFQVEFSEQKPSTDTICVNPDNEPFRTKEGDLVFRPGGHGALLENLNDLDAELVFIGNIDNVAPDRLKNIRIKYKKLLGGFLLEKVSRIHGFLEKLEKEVETEGDRKELVDFVREISPEEAILLEKAAKDVFREKTRNILNRPVRVCGMVKNVGEPGGGPFWIEENSGRTSKQIIESSQIDLSKPDQQEIFHLSTHFNPVDIACYIRNYKGEKFTLPDFRDPDTGFISEKSVNGKPIKALELPGLWNGSMAGWITYFAEVPLETFSPVKTVFDLLREEHQ